MAVIAPIHGRRRYVRLASPKHPLRKVTGEPLVRLEDGYAFAAVPKDLSAISTHYPDACVFDFVEWRLLRYYRRGDVLGLDTSDTFEAEAFVFARFGSRFTPVVEPTAEDWESALTRWHEANHVRMGLLAGDKVARALKLYADTARAASKPDGVEIGVKLVEIAAFTDLSREMVGREITALQEAGWLRREGQSARLTLAWSFLYSAVPPNAKSSAG